MPSFRSVPQLQRAGALFPAAPRRPRPSYSLAAIIWQHISPLSAAAPPRDLSLPHNCSMSTAETNSAAPPSAGEEARAYITQKIVNSTDLKDGRLVSARRQQRSIFQK